VSEVAVYTYDDSGQLSFVRAVPDSGAGPCWAIVNHAGSRLYATNTGDNSIAVYDLADPLNPVHPAFRNGQQSGRGIFKGDRSFR
jgi:6-phosphogluconolactonase (cycloisomerase 2 family)